MMMRRRSSALFAEISTPRSIRGINHTCGGRSVKPRRLTDLSSRDWDALASSCLWRNGMTEAPLKISRL